MLLILYESLVLTYNLLGQDTQVVMAVIDLSRSLITLLIQSKELDEECNPFATTQQTHQTPQTPQILQIPHNAQAAAIPAVPDLPAVLGIPADLVVPAVPDAHPKSFVPADVEVF